MPVNATPREQDLFCDLLELQHDGRAAWLDEVCGSDTAMRDRLIRLLDAHEIAERSTLEEPLDPLPERIDNYRIIRLIGEGGMGIVYEAFQESPVQRRVALKAVKPGMDTRQVIARFRAERQALAAMDHPYLAKIFDAGQTPAGRPYFVMEFVDGVPLLDYCEQRGLDTRSRLELFVLICQAVQHAHHKGVIHRDLKPGNILVASELGKPIPKIIDFGIARAVAPESDDLTKTAMGRGPGTPAYMSPEQAGLTGQDIDTRTDVYSLGVVLHELLTGELPPARGIPAARDLDCILSKALDPERERRYDTPLALAADLERFLDGRPVAARPPTLRYRASKFVRRYRVQVLAASVAIVAIVTGAIVSTYGLVRAVRAEAAAKQDAATARQVSDFLVRLFTTSDPNRLPGEPVTVRQVLEEGTKKVQTELAGMPDTQAALLGTLSHVHESLGSYRQAADLAEKALSASPSKEDLETASTLYTLARTRQRLGEFQKARNAIQRAIAIRTRLLGEESIEVAQALNVLGGLEGQLEHFDDAIAAHRRALAIQVKVKGEDSIATYNSWRGLSIVYGRQGNDAAALESVERILPIARKRYGESHPVVADALHNLALQLSHMGRLEEAEKFGSQALTMQRKLQGPNHPDVAFSALTLARTYQKQGRYAEAVPLMEDAVRVRTAALGTENIRTGEAFKQLGVLRIAMGQVEAGRKLVDRAIAIYHKAYGPAHTDTLAAHGDAGKALMQAGSVNEAIPHLRRVMGSSIPEKVRIDLGDPVFARVRDLLERTGP